MGRPKAALPITHRADTFLSRIIRAVASGGLPEIVVVTGAAPEAVRQAAGPFDRRLRFAHNPAWAGGQLSSLLTGLDFTVGDRSKRADPTLEALLVTLVDVPLVPAETVARIVKAWRTSGAPIVRPARGDVHGHPVIFDRTVFRELRAADPTVGAKAVVRAHDRDVLNVPIEDPGAFVDIDTEQDYRRALEQVGR